MLRFGSLQVNFRTYLIVANEGSIPPLIILPKVDFIFLEVLLPALPEHVIKLMYMALQTAISRFLEMVILQHKFYVRLHVSDSIRLLPLVMQKQVHHVDLIEPYHISLDICIVVLERNRVDIRVRIIVVVFEVYDDRWA